MEQAALRKNGAGRAKRVIVTCAEERLALTDGKVICVRCTFSLFLLAVGESKKRFARTSSDKIDFNRVPLIRLIPSFVSNLMQ